MVGLDAKVEAERRKREQKEKGFDPYPDPNAIGRPAVNVTPGNAPKGESATTIATRTQQ